MSFFFSFFGYRIPDPVSTRKAKHQHIVFFPSLFFPPIPGLRMEGYSRVLSYKFVQSLLYLMRSRRLDAPDCLNEKNYIILCPQNILLPKHKLLIDTKFQPDSQLLKVHHHVPDLLPRARGLHMHLRFENLFSLRRLRHCSPGRSCLGAQPFWQSERDIPRA